MDAGTFPWRDVLLTVALATAAIVLFLRRQPSTSPAANSISDEERRKRRERLAAIAEQRAAARKAREAAENGGKNGVDDGREISEAKNCRVAPTGQSTEGSANDGCAERDDPISAETNASSGERIFDKKSIGAQSEDVDGGENDSECKAGENMVSSDVAAKEKESGADGVGDVEEKSVPDNQHHVANNASTGASDGPQTSANEVLDDARDNCGHRERHAKAIAKIMAKKREMDETKPAEKPADPPLTVHLILTSSPGSSRLDLTIPTTATAAELLDSVSKASGVPVGVMKLIFRGRMITRQSAGRVAKEFGIEDGSALHVVGKPRLPRETDEEGDSAEESSDSEEDNNSDSEAEDERETVDFSSPRERAELVARIRGSSGEGYFHRAAQRGDLDALRKASVGGHSDLLRVPDRNGWTPLHEAARAGHADVVQYLVEHAGLDPNEATNQGAGRSPLSLALEHHGPHHPVTILLRTYINRAETASTNPWADGAESD